MGSGPAPAGGRLNLILQSPELYNLEKDPDESYDVSPENPTVIAEIQSRVERLIAGFPDEARGAWDETKARPTQPTPSGALPSPAKK